jgi:hypothetical protein
MVSRRAGELPMTSRTNACKSLVRHMLAAGWRPTGQTSMHHDHLRPSCAGRVPHRDGTRWPEQPHALIAFARRIHEVVVENLPTARITIR